MDTVWNKLKKGITDGYHTLSDRTEEMTKIGRLKLEIVAVKRDIEKAFIELGGRIYHALEGKEENDILSNQDVIKLVKDISAKEKKIRTGS